MKLKEYPSFIYHAARVSFLPNRAQDESVSMADCIVSLTSIPSRLAGLHLTIASLLLQDVRAKKIVLWLHNDLKESIPPRLAKLEGKRFEIRFRDHYYSHRKLIYALKEFGNDTIVTCDDDVIYRKTWLSSLLEDYQKYPEYIVAHECRELTYDSDGMLLPYSQWNDSLAFGRTGSCLVPIGYGGVLYPPGSLHSDVLSDSLFMNLAPRADDLWFKAMSLLAGTPVRRSTNPPLKPVPIPGTKKHSLGLRNVKKDENRKQWLALSEHYELHKLLG